MSTLHHIIQFLLAADGTNQIQRDARALATGFVSIDERDERQLLEFLVILAEQIRYYDLNNLPAGDWRPFLGHFMQGTQLRSLPELRALESSDTAWPPHSALLWACIQLFRVAQTDMNLLVDKHLSYYYSDVLRLALRPSKPDQLHVIFTPSKNAAPELILEGSTLDAGQFSDGSPRQYALDHDLVVTQTEIAKLLSSYTDRDKSGRKILFVSSDAKRIRQGTGESWRPFGTAQLSTAVEQRNMNAAFVGFSVASPVLLLEEGSRTITLSLSIGNLPLPPAQVLTSGFDVELTTPEGWVRPSTMTANITALGKLEIAITVPETLPSISKYDSVIHGSTYATRWPVMRCRLKPQAYHLETLEGLNVSSGEIRISVAGAHNLILQNDQALQVVGKPVSPFTSQPFIGANFYIGSNEVFRKSVTSLSVHLEWQDPPPDFAAHYSAYGIAGMNNSGVFMTALSLRASRNWNTRLLPSNQPLFNSNTAVINTIPVAPATYLTTTAGSGYKRLPDGPQITGFTPQLNQGFIKLELIQPTRTFFENLPADAPFEAFGHKSFATVYARQAIALAQFSGPGTPPELPKPPYTPLLKSVSLDYTATETFIPSQPNQIEEYFIEDLFGPHKLTKEERADLIPEIAGEGALYVGLKGASAPQGVSMLLQIEEGSTPGDTLITRDDYEWHYLTTGGWQLIDHAQIIEDSTRELQQPGLIRLNMGQDAVNTATRMPDGLHWLRMTARAHPDGAGSIRDLLVQAARATLSTQPIDQAVGEITVVEKSVTGLTRKRVAIKKVEQPFPSFGGQQAEPLKMFSRRVSERIRHRQRAVTSWDYERIILDQFPDIFKVKCITHMDPHSGIEPGKVHAVVIPDWRKRKSGSPLQPAANAAYLREIKALLDAKYTTPFTEVLVTNPVFETLLIDTHVSFHPEFDPGFHAQLLEEEIKRFLSPWAYEEGKDVQFGGKVYRSEILAFIEGREYVDFVIDFQLYHRHTSGPIGGIGQMTIGQDFIIAVSPPATVNAAAIGVDFIIGEPVDIAGATRPDTILVSNAYHRIQVLQGENICVGAVQAGIGQMIIGIDFVPIS